MIDLSRRSYKAEKIPREVIRKYLGGRGLGSYLLYKRVPAHIDPLSGGNHLIFSGFKLHSIVLLKLSSKVFGICQPNSFIFAPSKA
jgi:aldehyde:ferredoxin oxidoreductase